jgi:hypothetical protein
LFLGLSLPERTTKLHFDRIRGGSPYTYDLNAISKGQDTPHQKHEAQQSNLSMTDELLLIAEKRTAKLFVRTYYDF